jgi:deazaflavin-dependent oxidoreductase (nitroreductase family)
MNEEEKNQAQDRRRQIPTDMKSFNWQLIGEYRANEGRLSGQLAGMQVLLLTTKGVRTAEPRTAVVGYRMHGESYVTIASANGAPSHPAWYLNLLAEPVATVEVGAEKFQARARTATSAERAELARL